MYSLLKKYKTHLYTVKIEMLCTIALLNVMVAFKPIFRPKWPKNLLPQEIILSLASYIKGSVTHMISQNLY